MYLYRYASELLFLFNHTNECVGYMQSTGIALTIGGFFLGHMHGGRKFLESAHGTFANVVMAFIAVQLALGIYLKLHIHERSIRPYAVVLHGIVGKGYPIIGWTQMLLGAIAYMGYCRGGHLGQCLAHYIMVRVPVILALLGLMKDCMSSREADSSLTPSLCQSCFLLERDGYDGKAKVRNFTILLSSRFGYAQLLDGMLFLQVKLLDIGHRYAAFGISIRCC